MERQLSVGIMQDVLCALTGVNLKRVKLSRLAADATQTGFQMRFITFHLTHSGCLVHIMEQCKYGIVSACVRDHRLSQLVQTFPAVSNTASVTIRVLCTPIVKPPDATTPCARQFRSFALYPSPQGGPGGRVCSCRTCASSRVHAARCELTWSHTDAPTPRGPQRREPRRLLKR